MSVSVPLTLVRLKFRLMFNRARHQKGGAVLLAIAVVGAILLGVSLAATAVGSGSAPDPRISRSVLVIGATALTLVWTLLPLLTFGSDETLDPSRLVLLPLRRGPLLRGLLLASFVGPAPLVAILAVIGVALGYAGRGGWIIAVPAMALLLVLSAATARTVSTLLAAGLTSRRGRDASIIVASVLALAFQGLRFVRFSAVDTGIIDRAVDVLRWLPPGMLAQAVIDARTDRLLIAIAELVPAVLIIPLLLRRWAQALERSMTVMTDGQTPRQRRRSAGDLPLLFDRLPFLARAPWGAVTAKELRYVGRDPRRKVNSINSALIGLALPIWAALSSGGLGTRSVLLATAAGYIVVIGSSNQFGLDGAAVWVDVVAGDTVRTRLIGKNVAAAMQVLPTVAVVGAIVAAITGGWVYLPAAILLAVAGLGAGLATANVVSVRFPVRLPENRSPFAGRGGGAGCATSAILLVGALVQNLLLAPVAIATTIAVAVAPVSLVVVVPVCVAYGGLLWWTGLGMAERYGSEHQPELVTAVDPGRGG